MASSKGKKKSERNEEKTLEKCNVFLEDLQSAVNKDHESNSKQEPALMRLKMIGELNKNLNYKPGQMILLDNGVLNILKKWLEPMPDKTLPNIKIKKTVLEHLLNLPVKKGHLMESHVGKIVNFYKKNSREAKDVRAMAEKVVKKWISIVIAKDEYEDC